MNLSKKEAAILGLLMEGREMYGLEMVKRSEGKLKLRTIYITLSGLEEKGFTSSRKETEPALEITRRRYRITGLGAQAYRAWAAAPDYLQQHLWGVGNE